MTGPRAAAQLEVYSRKVEKLGTRAEETRRRVGSSWAGMRRDIDAQADRIDARVDRVGGKLRGLGGVTARPHVELTGAREMARDITVLEARMRRLGAMRVQSGGAGGGGLSSAPSGAGSAGAGGGRRGIGLGGALLGVAGLGVVALPPLGGAAVGLAGSAAGAALGGGALTTAGLGALGVGAGSTVAVAKPALKGLEAVTKAEDAYTRAVALHGRESRQAAAEQRKLTFASRQYRGALTASAQVSALRSMWSNATAPGRQQFYGLLADAAAAGRQATPNLAFNVNRNVGAVRTSGGRYARFLAGGATQSAVSDLSSAFVRDLPVVEQGLEHVTVAVERVARASLPFLHDAVIGTEHWAHGLDRATSDSTQLHARIGRLVGEGRDWLGLTRSAYHVVRDLFQMGAPAGDSMVVQLTHTFDRWSSWLRTHPAQVRRFFRDSVATVGHLAHTLGDVTAEIFKIGHALGPVLDTFLKLAQVGSGAGLLIPTLLRAGFGRITGGGGGGLLAGGGGRGAGAGSALVPGAAGGIRGAFGARMMEQFGVTAGPLALARGYGLGATAQGVGRAGLAAAGAGAASFGRFMAPTLAISGILGAATTQGNLPQRFGGGLSAATFGLLPAPMLGADHARVGVTAAERFAQGLDGRSGAASERAINARLGVLRGQLQHSNDDPGIMNAVLAQKGGGPTFSAARVKAEIAALGQLRGRAEEARVAEMRLHREMADQRGIARAGKTASELPDIFKTFSRKESVAKAMRDTRRLVTRELEQTHGTGTRILAQASLDWARAMARRNPQMRGDVDRLMDSIERRWRGAGRNIAIYNGKIYEGTRSEWADIAKSMSDPLERAHERMSGTFTAIQRDAVGSLLAMGYSKSEARHLVQLGESQDRNDQRFFSRATGSSSGRGRNTGGPQGTGDVPRSLRARGGRLPGRGLDDTVPMSDGGYGAPGELVINRHTEGDVDAILGLFGTKLDRMVANETRPHSHARARRARGGRTDSFTPGHGSTTTARGGGAYGGVTGDVAALISKLDSMGFHHGSTTGGGHAPGGFHPRGMAVDFGDASNDMRRLWSVVRPMAAQFAELFGPRYLTPGPTLMHFGQGFSSPGLQTQHDNHIHIALTHALGQLGRGGAFPAGSMTGEAAAQIRPLRAPRTRMRGVPGALLQRSGDVYAHALTQKINKHLAATGAPGGSSNGTYTGGGKLDQWLTEALNITHHFSPENLAGLHRMAIGESSGNPNARQGIIDVNSSNGSGGAQGLLQTIPATFNAYKLPGHDNIYNPVDNAIASIRYQYAKYGHIVGHAGYELGGRLGGPFANQTGPVQWGGWHAKGTDMTVNRPTVFGAGERGPERVTIQPQHGHASRPVYANAKVHVGARGLSEAQVNRLFEKHMDRFAQDLAREIDSGVEEDEQELMV